MISNLNVCIMHMVDTFIQSNLQVGEVSLGGTYRIKPRTLLFACKACMLTATVCALYMHIINKYICIWILKYFNL